MIVALIGSLAGLFGATTDALATDHDTCVGEGMPPPDGVEFLRSYRPGVAGPSRLAGDGTGNILVADPARNQVIVRAPDGRVLERRTFPTTPVAVAVDSRSPGAPVIYVGDGADGSVAAYSADWQPMFTLGQGAGEFQSVNDIAVSAVTGDVYVADGAADVVKIYGVGGAPLGSFGGHGSEAGLFDFPVALAIDDMRGEILVADQMNFRIQIFDLQGSIICRIGDNGGARSGSIFIGRRLFTVPQGLTVDASGRIYVADAAEGRIRVVDRDGTILAEIGRFGTGPDELRVPLDMAFDDQGRLIVADSNNQRLAIYGIGAYVDPEVFAPAEVVITPDPFDPFYSEPVFTALLEIPGHALSGVVPGTIAANGVPASGDPPVFGDHDRDGEPDMLVTFDAFELTATLAPSGPSPVVVRGSVGGSTFDATAIVTVIGHSIDADGDGITDDADRCLDTLAGAAIDGTGCAIVQLCPCSAQFDGTPWTTHGQFVECTVAEARRFAEAGLIGRSERGGIVSVAARAQCPGDG